MSPSLEALRVEKLRAAGQTDANPRTVLELLHNPVAGEGEESVTTFTSRLAAAEELGALAPLMPFPPPSVCVVDPSRAAMLMGCAAVSSTPGRGFHSSTFQLNLSRVGHTTPCPPV
jgi:hypothetical protein